MSEGRPHPAVERYVARQVSPAARIEALEAEVERLRALVPDPDDLRLALAFIEDIHLVGAGPAAVVARLRATLPTTEDARAAYRSKPAWGAGPEDVELESPRLGPAKGEDDGE